MYYTQTKEKESESKSNKIKMDSFTLNTSVATQMMKIIDGYRQEVTVKLAGKYGFDVKEAIAYLETKPVVERDSSASASSSSSSEDDEPNTEKKVRAPKTKKAKSVPFPLRLTRMCPRSGLSRSGLSA